MRIGIDVGGTKIEIVILQQNHIIYQKRVPTPQDYFAFIETIANLVNEAELNVKQSCSIGIGLPGTISPYTSLVKNANTTWLNGKPLQHDLNQQLKRDVKIANDANCFTVSEAIDGAAKRKKLVFGITLGTGCGGGLAIDGQCYHGMNGISGEWGHNALPWLAEEDRFIFDLPACYCGKQGCIEQFISGTGFERDFYHLTQQAVKAPKIIQLAEQQDYHALLALSRYKTRLAKAIAGVINLIDPDCIVLGGGMSNVATLYQDLDKLIKPWIFGGECRTPIKKALHGDSSGVRGAAWL